MRVLICTIMRDCRDYLSLWHSQLFSGIKDNPDISFDISVYENDSQDGTTEVLNAIDTSEVPANVSCFSIVSEYIGTQKFGSVISENRVQNLATARNKCIANLYQENTYNWIFFVEPDVRYSAESFSSLLRIARSSEIDIVSGVTYSSRDGHFYDSWATRGKGESSLSTKLLEQIGTENIVEVDSTFNALCLYHNRLFHAGIRFGYFSETFNHFDCDTAVICENARRAGFNKIYIIPSIQICHFE